LEIKDFAVQNSSDSIIFIDKPGHRNSCSTHSLNQIPIGQIVSEFKLPADTGYKHFFLPSMTILVYLPDGLMTPSGLKQKPEQE